MAGLSPGFKHLQTKKDPERLKILLSYWYYRQVDIDSIFEKYFTPPYPDVWADSGAFSAMTKGVTITCEEYAAWIKRWQHLFTHYSNLDVITDAAATWENQQRLEGMGLSPVPAFHILEDWDWLEHYLETYNYIALGVAGQQQKTPSIMRWLVKCFQMAGKQAVYHGFALTSWHIMKSFPWYSVDSSSWGQGFRYGVVPFFDWRRGGFVKLHLGNVREWARYKNELAKFGYNWKDFAYRNRYERAKVCAVSALGYIQAEKWIHEVYGSIHIPQRDNSVNPNGEPGLKLYLVEVASNMKDSRNIIIPG